MFTHIRAAVHPQPRAPLAAAPRIALQYSRILVSGARSTTLMRLRVELNSRMLSTSYSTSWTPSGRDSRTYWGPRCAG